MISRTLLVLIFSGAPLLVAVESETPVAVTPAAAAVTPAATPAKPLLLRDAIAASASTVSVGLSRLDAAIAHADLGAERMALLPNISATGGLTRLAPSQTIDNRAVRFSPYNAWDARLRVGLALLDLEAWQRKKSADRRLDASEAGLTVALEEAAASTGEAYVALAGAEALVTVRREDLRLADELLTQAEARVDAGASEGIAATRAGSRVAAVRAALVTAEGQVRNASITLARALDLDPAQPLTASDVLADTLAVTTAPLDPEAAVQLAHAERPELRVSSATLAALDATRQAARNARLLRIDGFADGGRTGPETDGLVTTWDIGIGVTIPLLDSAPWREEAAELRVAQERLRARSLDNRIRADVREALVLLETASARLTANRVQRQLAEQEISEARARFAAGAAGNLDIIQAQTSLTLAQEQSVVALQAMAAARVRLARAVGGATALH